MTDRPMLFSGPMVRALIEGRKSQTRRILKPQPDYRGGAGHYHDAEEWGWEDEDGYHVSVLDIAPNGYRVGDRIWVREAWRLMDGLDAFNSAQIAEKCAEAGYKRTWAPIQYEADGERDNWISDPPFGSKPGRLRSSRFMPRWASRLTLVVTDVRVQRLQEITLGDICAEGLATSIYDYAPIQRGFEVFAALWDSLNAKRAPWASNPWVAALSFTVHWCNINQMEGEA